MFPFHAALSLGMIALTGATALYAWSASRPKSAGIGFAKFISVIVIIFSITSTACTIYYGIKYWSAGYFQSPMIMQGMMQENMMGGNGMPKGMKNNCMMNCKNMTGSMNNKSQMNSQGHEARHPQ